MTPERSTENLTRKCPLWIAFLPFGAGIIVIMYWTMFKWRKNQVGNFSWYWLRQTLLMIGSVLAFWLMTVPLAVLLQQSFDWPWLIYIAGYPIAIGSGLVIREAEHYGAVKTAKQLAGEAEKAIEPLGEDFTRKCPLLLTFPPFGVGMAAVMIWWMLKWKKHGLSQSGKYGKMQSRCVLLSAIAYTLPMAPIMLLMLGSDPSTVRTLAAIGLFSIGYPFVLREMEHRIALKILQERDGEADTK